MTTQNDGDARLHAIQEIQRYVESAEVSMRTVQQKLGELSQDQAAANIMATPTPENYANALVALRALYLKVTNGAGTTDDPTAMAQELHRRLSVEYPRLDAVRALYKTYNGVFSVDDRTADPQDYKGMSNQIVSYVTDLLVTRDRALDRAKDYENTNRELIRKHDEDKRAWDNELRVLRHDRTQFQDQLNDLNRFIAGWAEKILPVIPQRPEGVVTAAGMAKFRLQAVRDYVQTLQAKPEKESPADDLGETIMNGVDLVYNMIKSMQKGGK